MKTSDFIKIMRKVVRDEVRTVIQEELRSIKPILNESATKTVRVKQATEPSLQSAKTKMPAIKTTFTGPLKDILNQTAQSMLNESYEDDEWPDMNQGALTSEDAQVGISSMSSLATMLNDDAPLPQTHNTSDPTRVFMKDYSAVLKAAEQHAMGK
jgi:hypothetical protein